jgi:hypothetical protein
VTIYGYKVVMITTLDGNRHHRPLFMSFVRNSTTECWKRIFDLFAACVSAALHPHLRVRMRNTFAFRSGAGPGFCAKANLFAVTTDHEKAIESGLEASALKLLTHRISCSLHAFWSK